MKVAASSLNSLPGAEIVLPGLEDLRQGRDTIDAAAVLLASRRLQAAGLELPDHSARAGEPGHRVFQLLIAAGIPDPHSRYNAILRRIDSFARALESGPRAR